MECPECGAFIHLEWKVRGVSNPSLVNKNISKICEDQKEKDKSAQELLDEDHDLITERGVKKDGS